MSDIKELVKRLRVAEVGETFQTEDGSPELLPTELGLAAADALEELAEWKRQVLASEATWDIQAVGRIIKVPLGGNIFSAIQPALEALAGEVATLKASLNEWVRENAPGGWIDEFRNHARERARLAGEVEGLKADYGLLCDTLRDDRAAHAEERDRLKAALVVLRDAPAFGAPDTWVTNPFEVRQFARKALGDAS